MTKNTLTTEDGCNWFAHDWTHCQLGKDRARIEQGFKESYASLLHTYYSSMERETIGFSCESTGHTMDSLNLIGREMLPFKLNGSQNNNYEPDKGTGSKKGY